MAPTVATLTVRFSTVNAGAYRVDLEGPDVGERHGPFALPYTGTTWQAVMQALEPGFVPAEADKTTQAALKPLGDLAALPRTAGAALANALLADDGVRLGFDVALGRAEAMRRPLPVEMRFGAGCDVLAALPWELLHYRDRFLLADTSIALSRYPEGAIPPTPALGELPLRVLLVLSEPVGASPIFPERAREELLHGLRTLDETGAVVVDLLRPLTFSTLVEAVTNGGYHMLVFYGHGGYDPDSGGLLLFEDEFGGPALIKASELGAALRNTDVRLVLLGACQSATTADLSGTGNLTDLNIWSGTAPALVRAGVPLAIGMQVSMRVDAALAFIRQFALSLAAGKPVIEAVGDARKPIIRGAYGEMWYAPALYGRPAGDTRLFDPKNALPKNTADLRGEMKAARGEIERLEKAISGVGVLGQPAEIAHLRQARARFAQARAEVTRRTPGGYAAVVSPLYGVPANPIFVGRTEELHDVAQAFASGHPVVIWGAGGIGKSALAAEIAHRQSWRFPSGVLWLDCRGGPEFDSLLNQIGAFAGIEAMDKVEPDKKEMTVKWALDALDARCLLVWDNAEEVWDERSVRRFVESVPSNCQALLTTRENPEQAMWPTVELGPLSGQAMHDLFYRLATAAGVKAGSQADLDSIPLILEWLQGHPLALALVVPLAMKRGWQRVWADLQARPLKGIEAAFEVSYERLTDLQRRVFTRLSVYTIPFDWPAAQALLPGEAGVEDALDTLVQRALVGFSGVRYGYHALLRQYAYTRLAILEDVRVIHRRAAEYLSDKGSTGVTPLESIEALDQWEKAESWEEFVRRTIILSHLLRKYGFWQEIGARLEAAKRALSAHLNTDSVLEALLLGEVATLAHDRGEMVEAINLWSSAVDLYRKMGNLQSEAEVSINLGLVYEEQGEWDRAIKIYETSHEALRRLGDSSGIGAALNNLGGVWLRKGDRERALALHEQALKHFEQAGDPDGIAKTYNRLGNVYSEKRDWDRAIESYGHCLRVDLQEGDLRGASGTTNNIAACFAKKGDWNGAILLYRGAMATMEQVGDQLSRATVALNLAGIYLDKGDWDQAIEIAEESVKQLEAAVTPYELASAISILGRAYEQKSEWNQASKHYQDALQIRMRLGDLPGIARSNNDLGNLYQAMGHWEEALEAYRKCGAIRAELQDGLGLAETFGNMAAIHLRRGNTDQALEYLRQDLQAAESVNDVHVMAEACNNLGAAHLQKQEVDIAVGYLEKALELMNQLGDKRNIARVNANLGTAYAAQKEWDPAIKHHRKALEVFQSIQDLTGIASAEVNLGNTYARQDKWEQSIDYFNRGLEIVEQLNDRYGIALASAALGRAHLFVGDLNQAYRYSARALRTFRELGAVEAEAAAKDLQLILASIDQVKHKLAAVSDGLQRVCADGSDAFEMNFDALLQEVAEACRDDSPPHLTTEMIVRQMVCDPRQPAETRAIGEVLTQILAGNREPDLTNLPSEAASAIRDMLDSLQEQP